MRRAALVTAICALTVVLGSCAIDPFPGDPVRTEAPAARPISFEWRGIKVGLEPTVVFWGRDAQVDVREIVRKALARIEGELHGSPTSIKIQAGSIRVIPDVGIGGFTDPASGAVEVTMDHRNPIGADRMLKTWLPLALAHELHHSTRIIDGPGYGTTLLEAMITEGSAEAFVRETFPGAPPIPWVKQLGKDEEVTVWHRAQRELDLTDVGPRHEFWFYGGAGLPRWAGYKIGYAIARAYLRRHPDRTAAGLASIGAREVLDGSGYDPGRTESENG
jgi:hypothetical protein